MGGKIAGAGPVSGSRPFWPLAAHLAIGRTRHDEPPFAAARLVPGCLQHPFGHRAQSQLHSGGRLHARLPGAGRCPQRAADERWLGGRGTGEGPCHRAQGVPARPGPARDLPGARGTGGRRSGRTRTAGPRLSGARRTEGARQPQARPPCGPARRGAVAAQGVHRSPRQFHPGRSDRAGARGRRGWHRQGQGGHRSAQCARPAAVPRGRAQAAGVPLRRGAVAQRQRDQQRARA